MAKALVSDELWALVAPLLPPPRPRPKGGRPPVDDRKALAGILFVLKSGIPWEMLPQEMGCGSGMTCWRRLRDWQRAGVFGRLQALLLPRLEGAGCLDWSRAVMDASLVRAKGVKRGATDRAEPDGPRPPVDEAPPPQRPAGRPAGRTDHAGEARRALRARDIQARIARRGVDSSAHLGRHRWVVERTFAHLNQMRRLTVHYERRADIYH